MSDHTRRDVLKVSGALLGGIAVGTQVTAAESDGRFLVDAPEMADDHPDLSVIREIPQIDLAVVAGPESAVEATGADYAPDTVYELDLPVDPTVNEDATDEPYYPIQWDKQAQNIPETQEITRGEGTRVAVIDSGVGAGHPDLQHAVNADLSRNFTGDGNGAPGPYGGYHGTHCAGIIAANDRNDAGVVGTAPGTEIVDCRVFAAGEGGASFANIVAAMVYAAAIGCDAANLSLGAYPIPRKGIGSFYGKVLQRTTAYVRRQGTLLVIAAGNDAADLQHDGGVISLPNEASNVVSVSATGPIGFNWGEEGLEAPPTTPANYTNYGTNAIDVSAPGGNYDPAFPAGWYYDLVFNTIAEPSFDDDGNYLSSDYSYAWLAGTSMAAPQVTAAAALVKSVAPEMNANQVRNTLERTADRVGDKRYHGKGFLDPLGAVQDAGGEGHGHGNGKGH